MCVRRTLASSGVFQVEHCSHCGGFSVHLGPMTIRLEPKAVRALYSTLQEALTTFDEEASRESSPQTVPCSDGLMN